MSEFVDVIAKGDLRDSLVALRDRLASELAVGEHQVGCSCECDHPAAGDPRAIAALSKELRGVLADIDKIPAVEGDDPLDRVESAITETLAGLRANRGAASEAPARP